MVRMVSEVAGLTCGWSSAAGRASLPRAIFVDCSRAQLLSSEMLSKLILLQGRLKQKKTRLVLSGLRAEVREVLKWARLDRFLEIDDA